MRPEQHEIDQAWQRWPRGVQSAPVARDPLAYFITFTCYGTRLHGSRGGSVDSRHRLPGSPLLPYMPYVEQLEAAELKWPPYTLDAAARAAVLDAIKRGCVRRKWYLVAAHIRTTHVHVIVYAAGRPEPMMDAFKAFGAFALNRLRPGEAGRKRWARHGSTSYLWDAANVEAAVDYVLNRQGEPMAVYKA